VRPARLPALVVLLWLASTLGWWAFAFMPLPSDPPAWLTAARDACFGSVDSGWPAASGWMLLVLAPAMFMVAIVALWGAELRASLLHGARTRLGPCVVVLTAAAVITEGVWVAGKLQAARAVEAWSPATHEAVGLPAAYPRQSEPAPEFALVNQHAARLSLAGLRGRPVVITFVFAHCQTLCPLIVDTLKRGIPAGTAAEVMLVTLDPWRDTPATLPSIARQWNLPPNFHVLSSGRVDEVLGAAAAYHVPFERNPVTGDIVHPGLVFMIDAQGRLAYTFNNPPPVWIGQALGRMAIANARLR
jgi:protein SCO1/2